MEDTTETSLKARPQVSNNQAAFDSPIGRSDFAPVDNKMTAPIDASLFSLMDRLRGKSEYKFIKMERYREDIFKIGKNLSEYMKATGTNRVIFMDRAARPSYIALREYWHSQYPGQPLPEIYFMNTRGFLTSDDLNRSGERFETYGDDLDYESRVKGDAVEAPPRYKTQEDVDHAVDEAYSRLLKDKDSPVIVFDTCVHSGDSLAPVLRGLRSRGMTDVRIGVTGVNDGERTRDRSGLRFDLTVIKAPDAICYPFHHDRMIQKTYKTPFGKRNKDRRERINSIALREEIKGIMQEYLSRMPKPPIEQEPV